MVVFLFIYLFIFVLLCVFDIFVFNRWHWRIPPCSLTMYEFNKQSSLLSKRCTWFFKLFSIRRTERESLKSGTNTHISALIIWIVEVPSWWWINPTVVAGGVSERESLQHIKCNTYKWDSLTASPNHSYFAKRRPTDPPSLSESLGEPKCWEGLWKSWLLNSQKENLKFWNENCISF